MNIKRRFIIGEEWLYIKVYSGPTLLEELLSNEIYEVVKSAYEDRLIDKFFFVRFTDDGHHLRLRFHVTDVNNIGCIVTRLGEGLKDYLDNRMIAKVTADTYTRELERYGRTSMEDLETIFSVNSWQILEILRSTTDYEQRSLQGIKITDELLSLFGFDVQGKYNFFESYYRAYSEEFGKGELMQEQLKKKNREYSKKLNAMLGSTPVVPVPGLNDAVQHIMQLKNDQRLEAPFESLLRSMLHMHFNRLYRVKQRVHELVIYYMLSNYYKSLESNCL